MYVANAIIAIARGSAVGIPQFAERVFVDGLQHALGAGIAGFFIGLERHQLPAAADPAVAARHRVPTVLHGLHDWILTWPVNVGRHGCGS